MYKTFFLKSIILINPVDNVDKLNKLLSNKYFLIKPDVDKLKIILFIKIFIMYLKKFYFLKKSF